MARGGNPNPKPGPGRPKGCPNKNTTYVRDMISYFLEKRVELVDELFLKLAKDNPADALRVMLGMFEYVIPKLQRHEGTTEINIKKYVLDVHDAALSAPPSGKVIEHD